MATSIKGESEATRFKQERLRLIGGALVGVAKAAGLRVCVVDATAGDGKSSAFDSLPSPLRWSHLAAGLAGLHSFHCIECHAKRAAELHEVGAGFPLAPVVHRAFWEDQLPVILERAFADGVELGLVYLDHNGALCLESLKVLAGIARRWRRVDFILNVPSLTILRCNGSAEKRPEFRCSRQATIPEIFRALDRRRCFISTPIEQDRWSMLLATNYGRVRPRPAVGFQDVNTREGADILRDLVNTREQKQAAGFVRKKQLVESYLAL